MAVYTINIAKKKFSQAYFKIAAITTRFRVIMGGANASKSYSVAQNEVLISLAAVHRTLVIRKVASTLKDSVFESFKNRLGEFGVAHLCKERLMPHELLLPNGSVFLFRGLDDPEKMKSIEGITRIVIEEASELDYDDFKELNRRIRGVPGIQITLIFNPIDIKHWLKRHFFDSSLPNCTTLCLTYQDNQFATTEDIQQLEDLQTYDENQYNIYALGKWGKLKTGSEYFPHFSRIKHVRTVSFLESVGHFSTSWDFNVVPYMSCICAQVVFITCFTDADGVKYQMPAPGLKALEVMRIRIYKEYAFESPMNSVEAIAAQISADHDSNANTLDYYGDSQGLNRIEGLGNKTRFSYVEEHLAAFLHNSSKKVKNPNVVPLKRRDLMNNIFSGKYPEVEIEIDESCEELIDDLENCKQGVKGKLKNRVKNKATGETYEEHGHMSDALEDMVSEICRAYIS